jgi:hypothetical protein
MPCQAAYAQPCAPMGVSELQLAICNTCCLTSMHTHIISYLASDVPACVAGARYAEPTETAVWSQPFRHSSASCRSQLPLQVW